MKRFLAFLLGLGGCAVSSSSGNDAGWPHWRGPQRDGTVSGDSLWDTGQWPPQEVWEANVGVGGTSPVLVGDALFVMGHEAGKETVRCLDAATGKETWSQSYPAPAYGRHAIGDQNFYRGPSASPEFDAATGYLFTLGIDGDLCCWDTNASAQGRKRWSLNLYDQFEIPQRPQVTDRPGSHRDYGFTGAPFVYGDVVIVEAGDPKRGNLLAFDKESGRLRWGSENRAPAGHTGGLAPMVVEGVPCLAALTATHLVVTRLDSARTVAEYPWATDFINNIPTPAVAGNEVIVTSRYNRMAMCKLAISLRGGAEKIWEQKTASGVCSPVIYRNHVYWSGKGIHCVSLKTGETLWSEGKTGDPGSCVVTGDGRLVVWANDGDLLLAEASPERFAMLSERKGILRDMAWPHVVFAGGRLFCKDRGGRLKCLAFGARAVVAEPDPEPLPPAPDAFDLADWPTRDDSLVLGWKKSAGKRGLFGSVPRSGRYAMTPRGDGGAFELVGSAEGLAAAFRKTNQFTLEAIFSPADLNQTGPARIVTFSEGAYARNFSLCQENDRLVLRLRTTQTGENGTSPESDLAPLQARAAYHCIVTYRSGELACYLNGREVFRKTGHVTGSFASWTAQHLLVGDEWADPRPWRGEVDGFALSDRCIDASGAAARYRAVAGR